MKYIRNILIFIIIRPIYSHIQISSTNGKAFCSYGEYLGVPETHSNQSFLSFDEPSVPFNKSGFPGLSMCIINQRIGKVIFYEEFPLYKIYSVWKDLERNLENISPERIVVLHMHGDSIQGLRNVTDLLSSYGSVFIDHLDSNAIWTWAYVAKGKSIFEKVTYILQEGLNLSSSSHMFIPLSNFSDFTDSQNLSKSTNDDLENKRWKFCEKYGMMGDLCDENSPAKLDQSHLTQQENSLLKAVPIIITAGGRASYLYQSLKSYFQSWGMVKKNLHVVLGNNSTKIKDLLTLFNITFTYIPPSQYGQDSFFSFLYYKAVYTYVFNHYRHYRYAIFLEEDVEISRDFFSYISQTMHLLDEDQSLYCITGHAFAGLKPLAHDETTLLRGSVQVGWGYLLTLAFIKKVLRYWPTKYVSKEVIYDNWMYYEASENRDCIYPEVSRSHHYGLGINTVHWLNEAVFFSTPIAKPTEIIKFQNTEMLKLSLWKKDLRTKISKSIPINDNPCKPNYLKTIAPGSYVMFFNFSNNDNSSYFNFAYLTSCFQGWIYSTQGQHDSVSILKVAKDIIFYLVAVPESSYSDLKPKNYSAIDIRTESELDKNLYKKMYHHVHNMGHIKWRIITRNHIFESLFS